MKPAVPRCECSRTTWVGEKIGSLTSEANEDELQVGARGGRDGTSTGNWAGALQACRVVARSREMAARRHRVPHVDTATTTCHQQTLKTVGVGLVDGDAPTQDTRTCCRCR